MGSERSVWPVPWAGRWLCSWASSPVLLSSVLKEAVILQERLIHHHLIFFREHGTPLGSEAFCPILLTFGYILQDFPSLKFRAHVWGAQQLCALPVLCVWAGAGLYWSQESPKILTLLSQSQFPRQACWERAVSSELSRCILLSWHFRVLSIIWGCKCILRDCLLMLQ